MGVVAAQLGVTGIIPNTTGLGKSIAQQIPTFILLETNNTLAQVLVSGFLNASKQTFGIPYSNQQIALVYTTDAGSVWLQIAVTGTAPNYVYSLIGSSDVASVFIASLGSAAAPSYTFSGDLDTGMYSSGANAVDFSTGGTKRAEITSAGLAVTGLVSATTSMAAGTTVTAGTGVIATTGTIQALAGNVIAGSSTNAASLISFPASAANGTLIISALNAGGAFNTTIRNSAMGQSTVYSLGDIGAATGGIPVATSVFVMKSVAAAAAAGGAVTQSFTDTFCTSGSNVIGNWNTQTNAGQVVKIVPGNGSFVVTSTADIGSGTFNYLITK